MSTEATPAPATPAVHPIGSAPSTATDPTDGAPPMPVPPGARLELVEPESVLDDEPEDPGVEDADREAARERRDSLLSVADVELHDARTVLAAIGEILAAARDKGHMQYEDPAAHAAIAGAASLARIADTLEEGVLVLSSIESILAVELAAIGGAGKPLPGRPAAEDPS